MDWLADYQNDRYAERYGTEVRWLGFPDFGYSKSLDETLGVWGERATAECIAAVIADGSSGSVTSTKFVSFIQVVWSTRSKTARSNATSSSKQTSAPIFPSRPARAPQW